MAISFTLDLTPNQIQFLQELDLYADGIIGQVDAFQARSMFITWVRKMIREGLVEHVVPGPNERYEGGIGGDIIIKAYRITDKGRKVLSLIEDDVKRFIERQRLYQEAKRNGRRRRA